MDIRKIKEISEAARILELPERATLSLIKSNYRKLVIRWHPDKCGKEEGECKEMIRKINRAYKVITKYIKEYKFPLSEDAIVDEESYMQRRFGNDPIWG